MVRIAIAAALLAAATVGAYDPKQALSLAYASSATYCDPSIVTPWSCQSCGLSGLSLSPVTYLENDNTENYGYTGKGSDGNIYIAYRGSDNILNWINNIDAILIPYAHCSGCNVHQGFWDCYQALAGQLDTALASMNGMSSAGIVLTGHSLGAAMTMLTTFDLAAAGYPVDTMLNFGQPRAGDPTFAAGFESFVIRGNNASLPASSPISATNDGFHLNIKALAAHMQAVRTKNAALAANGALNTAAPAHLPINPLQVRAVARALQHPVNGKLGVSDADADSILAVLSQHASVAVAAARGEDDVTALLEDRPLLAASGVHEEGGALYITPAQMKVLSQLVIPFPEPRTRSIASAPATQNLRTKKSHSQSTGATLGFTGAQAYRVVHNADIVPHLPPEILGYAHSYQEIWYNEPSTNYTQCSVTTGEDPNCSDSIPLPISTADHLDYLAIKIDGLC